MPALKQSGSTVNVNALYKEMKKTQKKSKRSVYTALPLFENTSRDKVAKKISIASSNNTGLILGAK